jgi:hypothetical protein
MAVRSCLMLANVGISAFLRASKILLVRFVMSECLCRHEGEPEPVLNPKKKQLEKILPVSGHCLEVHFCTCKRSNLGFQTCRKNVEIVSQTPQNNGNETRSLEAPNPTHSPPESAPYHVRTIYSRHWNVPLCCPRVSKIRRHFVKKPFECNSGTNVVLREVGE